MELELGGLFDYNTTFDYQEYEYKEDCVQENTSDGSVAVFLPILCFLVMALGLLGNGLILVVLWQKKLSWSVTDIFVVHLSVADILLLLTMPLWTVEAVNEWTFGTPLCRLTGAIFSVSFYCGIFLLVCISLDHYLSIVHGVQMYSHKKPVVIQLSCMAVWIFSLLLSIPDFLYLQAASDPKKGDKTQCGHRYPSDEWRLASRLLYHVLGFMLPAASLLYFFSFILLRLQTSCEGLQRQRAMRVILALVVAFFISWTPYNITLLVDTIQNASSGSTGLSGTCVQSRWTALNITAVLAFLHCCLNPMIYFIFSEKFRRWVLTVLRCGGCSLDSRDAFLWDSERVEETAPTAHEEKGSLHQMSDLGQIVESQKTEEKPTIDQGIV
ncbi:C-X-C chemokine receptor type 3-like [Salminus brasiliensis]|uniref:C-X-C chemokine receptor type 3-like n=1 Tax=Salminus brasiliensis TaxID=930266 RepID=UPI003B82E222